MLTRTSYRLSPSSQSIQPRSGGQFLPAWTPNMPPGGWTPSAAWEAAQEYAASLSGRTDLPPVPRMETCAYITLLGAVPGLHFADILERLQGRAALGAEPDEDDEPNF